MKLKSYKFPHSNIQLQIINQNSKEKKKPSISSLAREPNNITSIKFQDATKYIHFIYVNGPIPE